MGPAIAQGVSRWPPTAAARVRARVRSGGICGRQSGAGTGFLQVLRFPLPIFIPPIVPQSPVVAAVLSGLSLTPLIIITRSKSTQKQTSSCEAYILSSDFNKNSHVSTIFFVKPRNIQFHNNSSSRYRIVTAGQAQTGKLTNTAMLTGAFS
jgi:hypothetical protein